jgi:predicted XRE-type DNA-binding protein
MSFTHSKNRAKKHRSATSKSAASGSSRSSRNDRRRGSEVISSGGNVFQDMGFSPEEALNLHLRSQLMIELRRLIEERGLTQNQAAKLFGVTQPRISNLVSGKIDLFSLDHLIKIAGRAGAVLHLAIERSAA